MQGKVICVGSGDPRTFPKPYIPPNGNCRVYYWPGPGEVFYYAERAGEPERRKSALPYGMLVIDNLIVREDDIIQREVTMREVTVNGAERARDIARRWFHLGAFVPAEETPSEGEIAAARLCRRQHAESHLHVSIRSMQQNLAGKYGKAEYDPSDEGWAGELGRKLPRTFEQLPVVEKAAAQGVAQDGRERAPCPRCLEMIVVGAKVCKECGAVLLKDWEFGAEEPLASPPEAELVAAPARKR